MTPTARRLRRWLIVGLLLAPLTLWLLAAPVPTARGKQGAAPTGPQFGMGVPPGLTPDQQQAQDLALADPRVLAQTTGHKAEVFGVTTIGADYPAGSAACATADCRQVEIYLFDQDTAVVAIVDLNALVVRDVLVQPGVQPGVNQRVSNLAAEIARTSPEFIVEAGYEPARGVLTPMDGGGADCPSAHLCLAMVLPQDNSLLWAVVDVTDEKLVTLVRTPQSPDEDGQEYAPGVAADHPCPAAGTADAYGWHINYETTGTDGFRVYDVTHWGVPVLKSAKLAEWHVDYGGGGGFEDTTGCGGMGGGFVIYPYGNTQVTPVTTTDGVPGFDLAQDFRMGNWGAGCNYRYKQHYQFFEDGRFRTMAEAYGKGCSIFGLYRGLMRLDLAVAGDGGDSLQTWDGAEWVTQTVEVELPQLAPYTATGAKWRVADDGGWAYQIVPGQGQFADGGRGDNAYLTAVVHHNNEGDTDLGIIGDCCNDNDQGPSGYVGAESLVSQNLVLWYRPQQQTVVSGTESYCWTITGEPNPETYPCAAGPMFVPEFAARFVSDAPVVLGTAAHFTGTALSPVGLVNYLWNFGDGGGSATTATTTYTYAAEGLYTVTLTVSDTVATDVFTGTVYVGVPVTADFTVAPGVQPTNVFTFANTSLGSEPLTYLWTFGDGLTSTVPSPQHTYGVGGPLTVTLTVSNPLGSDLAAQQITVPFFTVFFPMVFQK